MAISGMLAETRATVTALVMPWPTTSIKAPPPMVLPPIKIALPQGALRRAAPPSSHHHKGSKQALARAMRAAVRQRRHTCNQQVCRRQGNRPHQHGQHAQQIGTHQVQLVAQLGPCLLARARRWTGRTGVGGWLSRCLPVVARGQETRRIGCKYRAGQPSATKCDGSYDSSHDSRYDTKYDTWTTWPKLTDPDRLPRTRLPTCPLHKVFLC